jgi:hypothetical protein
VARRGPRFEQAFVAGDEPVTLVFSFPPMLSGKVIAFRPSPEVTIQAADGVAAIGANGKLAMQVQLAPAALKGKIGFTVDGVLQELALLRVPLPAVVHREASAAEAGQ